MLFKELITEYGHWFPRKRSRQLEIHQNDGLELIYIKKGNLEWEVDGVKEKVRPNSIFYTLPWESHGSTKTYESGSELFYVVFPLNKKYQKKSKQYQFHKNLMIDSSLTKKMIQQLTRSTKHSYPTTSAFSYLLKSIVNELSQSEFLKEESILLLFQSLILEFTRILHKQENFIIQEDGLVRVESFLDELENKCHRLWSLDEMAECCKLGRTQFANLVEQITGEPPVSYLNRLRIEKSKLFLKTNEMSITDIGFLCGFQSSQYFSKIFKDYEGVSPKSFK
ncbi:MAG: hypothetical protein COA79_23845 [Planctomycetota bacterium]|nr:MAG: hypothetical protein COA79_23845 [Planctomycetota bacterium]